MDSINSSIFSFRHCKERAYKRRQLLHLSEMRNDHSFEMIRTGDGLFANPVIFQVVPDLFVRIKFWGVRRKVKKLKFAFSGGDEPRNCHRFVNWVSINNQKYSTRPVMNQPFQEFNENLTGNFTFDEHESHCTPRGNRRNHTAAETGTSSRNYRCLATNRPRPARMKIGAYPCLIAKKYIGLLLSCQNTNLGVFLFNPLFNEISVLLKSSPERPLGTEAKLVQQATGRSFAKTNVELTPDQLPDHDASPQCKRKFYLSRIFHHCIVNPFQHLASKFRWAASTFSSVKCIPSSSSIAGKPAEQCRSLYSQYPCHQECRLPILNRGYPPFPQFSKFTMFEFPCICISHASIIANRGRKV